jgi:hypothetical protein
MLYLTVALVVYVLTAADLVRGEAPESFREALGGALACALVAAVWPVALVWRGLLGGSRADPMQPGEIFTAKYAKNPKTHRV